MMQARVVARATQFRYMKMPSMREIMAPNFQGWLMADCQSGGDASIIPVRSAVGGCARHKVPPISGVCKEACELAGEYCLLEEDGRDLGTAPN
jgi:hypothetical protein